MDACLQVAHSVTEEVTGLDIVHSQIRLAEGASLAELGLKQGLIALNGAAIQCRITSEDPINNFRPQYGRLKVYRIGDGMGIRKDGLAYDGGTVSKHYEPLLSKVISHASNHKLAAQRMLRCLRESKIRGIETNLNFLKKLMTNPTFIDGAVTTSFIEDNLYISETRSSGLKLLRYMAEVKINGAFSPLGVPDAKVWRATPEVPKVDNGAPPDGFKSILDKEGPSAFAKALRQHKGVLITDTTLRDANQSLLATRVRTKDMLRIAPFISQKLNQLRSMENWGGATFHVCMNFLYECPWERLELLRKAIPNVPFQCIFRGSNIFGYSSFPDNVINEFVVYCI
ncbi:biotin carboxylase domain protein [Ostertagia ostertagi]